MSLRRILLVRHGETDGESSVRYHGSGDVDLSAEGRRQMQRVARRLGHEREDLYLASNLRRSWHGAALLAKGAPVRIEADFREIDFGRFEGKTREEIQAAEPVAYEQWQSGAEGFEYPDGEARADFEARIRSALERVLAAPGHSAVAVLHKGVIREIVRQLTGSAPEQPEPELGGSIWLVREPDGSWRRGLHSSDPPGLGQAA